MLALGEHPGELCKFVHCMPPPPPPSPPGDAFDL